MRKMAHPERTFFKHLEGLIGPYAQMADIRSYALVAANLRLKKWIAAVEPSSMMTKSLPLTGRHGTHRRHKKAVIAEARRLWAADPTITIADMALRDEITNACEGNMYAEKTMRDWIKTYCPNRKPGRRKHR